MHKRWVVAIENFTILSAERFSYLQYASLGRAQDERDRINNDATRRGARVRASLHDNKDGRYADCIGENGSGIIIGHLGSSHFSL